MDSVPDFPGFDGFLGTRASFMLDFVFSAMFVVIAVMAWSVYQVRFHRRYQLHKWIQLTLAAVLLFRVRVRLRTVVLLAGTTLLASLAPSPMGMTSRKRGTIPRSHAHPTMSASSSVALR